LGLLGPVDPALMLSVMLVATFTVHRGHGFFAMNNEAELPIVGFGKVPMASSSRIFGLCTGVDQARKGLKFELWIALSGPMPSTILLATIGAIAVLAPAL
jgi:hypothetical protein